MPAAPPADELNARTGGLGGSGRERRSQWVSGVVVGRVAWCVGLWERARCRACTTTGPPGCELSGGGGEVSRAVGRCGVVSEVEQGTCRGYLAWMWGVRRGGSGFGSARSAVHAPPPAT